jgi:tetratricopeptide (TPR) repeat protein
MNFICTNSSCAIAISKASFPVAMNCPVCQTLLVMQEEEPAISAVDEILITSLPYVIAYPLRRTLAEKHLWTKVNLLKDTFLNYLKYLGLLSASEFFNSNLKDKKMVSLFQQALAEPSFGSWNQYIRETLQFLKEQQHAFFCAELVNYYEAVETGKKRKLYKGEIEYIDSNGDVQLKKQEATAIGMLINFRNRYLGHGLTLDEKAAQQLWDEYFPLFRTLLEQMQFASQYTMFKYEHGETYKMKSAEISTVEKGAQEAGNVWLENLQGEHMNILPFFVVPGEVSLAKEDKEQILTYESYTGKTIKFFSPEGTEKQSSGKILEKLNLLLRDKQKEKPYTPEEFSKEIFMARVAEENKLILDTLIAEKKLISGVYVHREDMEIKLREWIGARMSIFFIAAEAGSGKTNLLVEMQKQYTEREIPSLLIRAGRMEKQTLREQLAYLLNIDAAQVLSTYKHIAGTQASPTIVLIDGLNEAAQAEALWQEVLDISKMFEPGSLKFVVTSRANSKADIERYVLAESDENLVYGENKDHEQGLCAYTHWLTALNMVEMKNAWEDYVQKDKNKYKPQFSFDDLATFDRALYNSISNPLVLRLFLETYHNKALPKKGNKHLNIWADWLAAFTDAEQEFFKLLTDAIWEKGENELLLDDVLKNKNLKPYFTDDRINAPYPRLKNNGWISRYVKDLNACVAFTVEGALLFIFGKQLQNRSMDMSIELIDEIFVQGLKLQKAGFEAFLCEEAMVGELGLITDLIDSGGDKLEISIRPLLHHLKAFGVEDTLSKLLQDTTENDWQALLKLNKMLNELQLQVLRKELLYKAIEHIEFSNKYDTEFGLIAISVIDDEKAQTYFVKINQEAEFLKEDAELLELLGRCEKRFARFDNALYLFQKCLDIQLKTIGGEHPDLATSYYYIGSTWDSKGEYNKALEFYQKCLDIELKTMGGEHPSVATSYNAIGGVWESKGEYDKALEFYQKCLDIELKTLGGEHPSVATTYNNFGVICLSKGEYDKAIEFYNKCLEIELKTLGGELATSYSNIGFIWYNKGEYDKALEFYHKCLEIDLKTMGGEHPDVATSYYNIGGIWKSKGEFDKALEFYQKCLAIQLKTLGGDHPSVATSYNNIGLIWKSKDEYDKALEFYQKCLDIQLKTLGVMHPFVAISYGNIGGIWLIKGEYDKALEFFQKCLVIELNTHEGEHPSLATTYSYIGVVLDIKGEIDKSLEFFQKSLAIQMKNLGEVHPDVATAFWNIGLCLQKLEEYTSAIKAFDKGYKIERKGGYAFRIGSCHEKLGNKKEALDYFIQSAEIRKNDPEIGLSDEATLEAIENAKRLAKEFEKENELPAWMKNI